LKALRWLVDIQTDPRGHFTPIGNAGWRVRGRRQARFDQQPIEIQHMVDALLTANRVTGDQAWLEEARRCHDWFLGRNDLQQIIADRTTGGCRDGLQSVGVNQNQGAESTLAWLHSSLRMHAALSAIVPAEEEHETRRRGTANVVPLAARGIAAPH